MQAFFMIKEHTKNVFRLNGPLSKERKAETNVSEQQAKQWGGKKKQSILCQDAQAAQAPKAGRILLSGGFSPGFFIREGRDAQDYET